MPPVTTPRIRTIAVLGQGRPMENFEYSLAETPCAEVVTGNGMGCATGMSSDFPAGHPLAGLGVEECICTPLRNSAGETMGLMAALSRTSPWQARWPCCKK